MGKYTRAALPGQSLSALGDDAFFAVSDGIIVFMDLNTQKQRAARPDDMLSKTVKIEDALPVSYAPDSRRTEPETEDLHARYSIQAKVGGGGMGVVYLAKDKSLGRYVAIKRLNASSNCDPALRKRFLNEAHSVAALSHIHIVHVYSLGEDAEGPYIVMEYIEGPTPSAAGYKPADASRAPNPPLSLEADVSENGQYALSEAIEMVIKISKAVAYAHALGIIHRDLKPSNILLDPAKEPKIVDFGLARRTDSDAFKLTGPGDKLLSLGYGAPEQERDASVSDERSDVYGLGGLLFFAITGQNPRYFREQDIPVPVRETLIKALAPDREQRWPTVRVFLDALTAIQSRTRIEQPPAKTAWRCKWCDTVNPVTIRFCSECGWDGCVPCPECETENMTGMQFCGKCGADIRVYESVTALLGKINALYSAREYEKAVSLCARAQGFDPAGPVGREILRKISEIENSAKSLMGRREQLRQIIPMELRAENFERALKFIEEFRAIANDKILFEEECRTLPERIIRRDYRRASRALKTGNGDEALEICENILSGVSPANPEFTALKKRILKRRRAKTALVSLAFLFLVFAAYLALVPPLLSSFADKGANAASGLLRAISLPAVKLYASMDGILGDLPGKYAGRFGLDMSVLYETLYAKSNSSVNGNAAHASPPSLARLMQSHGDGMERIQRAFMEDIAKWEKDYLADLGAASIERQRAGDYLGYNAAEEESSRFGRTRSLAANEEAHPAVKKIQERYVSIYFDITRKRDASIENAKKATVSEMQRLLSEFTRDNDIESARAVNNELMKLAEQKQ